jgi:hypothetical protein
MQKFFLTGAILSFIIAHLLMSGGYIF